MSDPDAARDAAHALVPVDSGASKIKIKIAASMASATREDFVYIGRRGEVRSPWRYQARRVAAFGVTGAAAAAGIGLCWSVGLPWVSLIYLGSLGYLGVVWRRAEQLKTAGVLVARDRLDEAEPLLRELTGARFVPRAMRASAWQNLARLESQRGNNSAALEHIRTAGHQWDRVGARRAGPWRWIHRFTEVMLLAELGRIEEANALRPGLAEAPDGDLFVLLRMSTDLVCAFMADDPSDLPTDLHPWTRTALQTTTAELSLVLLAWAHLRRDDADMGHHLLTEARERINPQVFGRSHPAVSRWLDSLPAHKT